MICRFRTIPPQYCANEYIEKHIARNSLRTCEDGYTWKFDPAARSAVILNNNGAIAEGPGAVCSSCGTVLSTSPATYQRHGRASGPVQGHGDQ